MNKKILIVTSEDQHKRYEGKTPEVWTFKKQILREIELHEYVVYLASPTSRPITIKRRNPDVSDNEIYGTILLELRNLKMKMNDEKPIVKSNNKLKFISSKKEHK